VLVLSEAVLVLVIDVRMVSRGTIGFHRHSGQHHNGPIEDRIHRNIVLKFDSVGSQQHVLEAARSHWSRA
tara:strand:+ start:513 stop:722 length:210 start_codon:yes stop_codon:yes gene_type:complete